MLKYLYFKIELGVLRKFYFIFAPKNYNFSLQGFCEISDLFTRVPQMLKEFEERWFTGLIHS